MQQTATLVQSRMLSPHVAGLSLSVDAGAFSFDAGQWINLFVPSAEGMIKRAYSIASAPHDREIELAVTRVEGGVVSPVLHALSAGATLAIDGPHGLFTRDAAAKAKPALFVATGTGLSPFRSMWRDAEPQHAPITVLFGARTEADILWRDELEALAERDPAFRFEVTLSRPDASWTGRKGYVQTHLASVVPELSEPDVYICGLTKMVSEVRTTLKQTLSYDRKRIHSERYD